MPLLTLSTDFGYQDYLSGAVKGALLNTNDSFHIIDISHALSPFNYPQAAYVCRTIFKNFPTETFHLILVDLFDNSSNQLLLAEHKNQYIGIADNGLLTMILEQTPQSVVALPYPQDQQKNILNCTKIFAEAFQKIISGKDIHQCGNAVENIQVKKHLTPIVDNNWIEGQILFIDHFENVIVNIHHDLFETHRKGRKFKIYFKRDEYIDKISNAYNEAAHGEKLAIFNSAGYLEIAINKGNAAGLFGLKGLTENKSESIYSKNRFVYQSIRVYFED